MTTEELHILSGDDSSGKQWDDIHDAQVQIEACDPKRPRVSATAPADDEEEGECKMADAGGIPRALPLWSSEQLGSPRLADSGTLGYPQTHSQPTGRYQCPSQPCAVLGGGKRGREMKSGMMIQTW